MPKALSPDVKAYLAQAPPPQRAALMKLRAQILDALPGARERISYKIPAFESKGRLVVWMAAFPKHCSLFGGYVGGRIAEAHGGKSYEVKGSTVRFAPEKGLPTALVRKIVNARLKENAAAAKRTRPKKRAKGKKRDRQG